MNPAVSVIMPTKDRADYVKRAIGSTTTQSFGDWELIVVDDSSDSAIERLCLSMDRRVKYNRRPRGMTASEARDFGLTLAAGSFVGFLDSDDWWDQDRLKLHMNAWRRFPKLGLTWDTFREIPGEKESAQPLPAERVIRGKDVARALFRTNLYNFLPISSMFTRREIVFKVGFPKWTLFCDYALALLICEIYPAMRLGLTLTYHDTSSKERLSLESFDFEREGAINRLTALRRRPDIYWKVASMEFHKSLTKIIAGMKNRDKEYTRGKVSAIWPFS